MTGGHRAAIGVLVLAALLALYLYGQKFLFQLDWEKIRSAESPSGEYAVVYYRSKSEAGHAPYGDNLVIKSWKSFPYAKSGETFFAGYCGTGLDFEWIGNDKIKISCPSLNEDGAIRTRASFVHGIAVEVAE